jgi:hypothetical protein
MNGSGNGDAGEPTDHGTGEDEGVAGEDVEADEVDGGREDPAGEEWDVSLEDLDRDPDRIEPGSPSPENVVFVLLGVVLTLAVIYRLVSLVGATVA